MLIDCSGVVNSLSVRLVLSTKVLRPLVGKTHDFSGLLIIRSMMLPPALLFVPFATRFTKVLVGRPTLRFILPFVVTAMNWSLIVLITNTLYPCSTLFPPQHVRDVDRKCHPSLLGKSVKPFS